MSWTSSLSKSFSKGGISGGLLGAGTGFMLGGPVGAGIGAVAGAGLGTYSAYQTDAQNRANKKAIDKANAYDLYLWDLANQYNDPSAQMKRLAAAGLNPNLVYGSGSVTGNTTGTAGSNGVASQEVFNAVQKGLPLAQGLANLRNTNSQNELLQYQMGQTMAQTDYLKAQQSHMEAETTNLNNFLNHTGRSTYDPVIQKNITAGIDAGGKALNWLNTKARPASQSLGERVGTYIRSWFTGAQ